MQNSSTHRLKALAAIVIALALCLFIDVSCKKKQGASGESSNPTAKYDSLISLANECYKNADFTRSIEVTREAMKSLSKDNLHAMSNAYSHLASCYRRIGMNDYALSNGFAGLNIDEKLKDNERMSSSYSNIAAIYLAAQRPKEAKTFITKSLDIEKNIKNPDSTKLSTRYSMAAEIYLKLNEPDSALTYINKALSIEATASDTVQRMRQTSILGDIYAAKDSTSEALDKYLEVIDLLQKKGDKYNLMVTYKNLGALYVKLGDKASAQKWLEQSAALAKECNAKSVLKEDYLLLANIMSENNPSQAAKYLSQSNSLADSLYNETTSKLTSYYAMEFQTKQKQLKIDEQQNSITIQKLIITIAVIAVILLLVVCIALFIINMLRSRARKAERNAEQMRDRFFTNVTHEFRTPLTVILGEAEELKAQDNPAKHPRYNAIINQGNHLLSLVNQLLSISKVRTSIGSLPWKNGDLAAMMTMIVENMRVYASKHDTTLLFNSDDGDFNIDFVPEYCQSIITNLISNAIKFASPGGTVNVDLSLGKKNFVNIVVSDNGCGIKKKDLPHIFDLFYQGDTEKTDLGTGIGLSLAKQMTEAMKGRIEVTSIEGEGSTFTVSIPSKHKNQNYPKWIPKMLTPPTDQSDMQQLSTSEITPSGDYVSNDDKQIALVVEDNADVASFIEHVMEDTYNVVIAHDGEEGLNKAREIIPDIIITDLMMPKVDGIEMCRMIRNDELVSHVPIIIVSARNTDKDRLEGLATGADAYLVKPFKRDELIAVANNLLHTREILKMKYQAQISPDAPAPTQQEVEIVDKNKIMSGIARKNEIFIEKVKSVILKNIAKSELNSALIADAMNLSQRQLNRKVNSVIGIDTASYIRQMRIIKAQELLLETEDPVGDIGYNCGFESNSYFSKIFKQHTGLTPSDYRRQHSTE